MPGGEDPRPQSFIICLVSDSPGGVDQRPVGPMIQSPLLRHRHDRVSGRSPEFFGSLEGVASGKLPVGCAQEFLRGLGVVSN